MTETTKTIDLVALVLCHACQEVVSTCTGLEVKYADTAQIIPKVGMRPELGCFVTISGDFRGLVVINLPGKTAVNIYRSYMTSMGMPEDGLPNDYTSLEVSDGIGEITNQIMGTFMRKVQESFELVISGCQPKALALNSQITLTIESGFAQNRRMAFTVGSNHFTIEFAMEQTEFVSLSNANQQ